jgi:outer membrane protein OmpA-like peptidoglycan-associated protein
MAAGAARAAACIAVCALAAVQAGCGAPHTGAAPEPVPAPPAGKLEGRPPPAAAAVSAAGNSAATPGKPACAFITREQMAQLLGAPIGTPIDTQGDGASSCTYPPGAPDSYSQADIEIRWSDGSAAPLEQQLARAFGDSEPGQQVAHAVKLGDSAFFSLEGVLSIKTGKTRITVTLPMRPDTEARAVAIGKALLAQIGTASPPPATAATAPANGGALPDGLSLGDECPIEVAHAAAEEQDAIVPLKAGLTLSSIWTPGNGADLECLEQITAVDDFKVEVTESCPAAADGENVTQYRRICQSDLRDAYTYRTETADKRVAPPVSSQTTMFSLSRRSLRELKATGTTRHRYVEIKDVWRGRSQPFARNYDGSLTRQTAGEHTRILINDKPRELPTLTATAYPHSAIETSALIVDDERFPLLLDYQRPGEGFGVRYTKISYPGDGNLERQLAVDKHVDVNGIYFDFASDRLRAESAPVLAEIAAVLGKNAEWKLSIQGHTDKLGADADNLALSRLRAEAVKSALVERYQIGADRLSTAGFGASRPQAGNDTPAGRARNRRVELIRQ